jgi:hypothetical protein
MLAAPPSSLLMRMFRAVELVASAASRRLERMIMM